MTCKAACTQTCPTFSDQVHAQGLAKNVLTTITTVPQTREYDVNLRQRSFWHLNLGCTQKGGGGCTQKGGGDAHKREGDAHKKEGGMHTKLLKSCSTSLFVMHHVVRRHARLCCSIGLLLSCGTAEPIWTSRRSQLDPNSNG